MIIMKTNHQIQRSGFTLVELLLAVSVMTILLGGLASAVLLASHALPDPKNPMTAVTDGSNVLEQISSEIYSAINVTQRTPTSITFTVHDRNVDGNPEIIRYRWSGIPGDPLKRKYNGFIETTVASAVFDFNANYIIDKKTKTISHDITTYTPEQLLVSFENWGSIASFTSEQLIDVNAWISQYFEVIPPDGATELVITRAKVKLRANSLPSPMLTVGIHRSLLDGSFSPDQNSIGNEAIIPEGVLDMTPLWMEPTFTDMIINNPDRTDYCLVMKGITPEMVFSSYLNGLTAPANGMAMKWTDDAGTVWLPPNQDIDKKDLLFYVYGSFGSTTTVIEPVDQYFLKSVDLALQLNDDPQSRVTTSVQILNVPEIVP